MKKRPSKEKVMSQTMVEVQGTLTPEGTLVLDEKPSLPAGRVRVTVQPMPEQWFPQDDVISVLRRIHANQNARGYVSPSKEEIDAEIDALRQEDEERMQGIERLQEECQSARALPAAGEGS
jgi:hypothetical protein